MHNSLGTASGDPATRVLVDDWPGRQIVRHVAPMRASSDNLAHAIVDLAQIAQIVTALQRVFGQQVR
jgi:hypothetical protein